MDAGLHDNTAVPRGDQDAARRDIRAGLIMIGIAVALSLATIVLRPGGAVIFGFGLFIAGAVALVRGIKSRN